MSDTPRDPDEVPVKDFPYDLIHVLAASLHSAWRIQRYAEDAARAGDAELEERFRGIHRPGLPHVEPGGRLLGDRVGDGRNAAA